MNSSALGSLKLGSVNLGHVPSTGATTLTPAAATLTFATTTPGLAVTIRPAAAALTFVGATPTVIVGANVVCQPAPATITFATFAPVVQLIQTLYPAPALIVFATGVPVVSNAAIGFYNYSALGGDPTEFSGAKLPPNDPNPTIGTYGYEQFD